MDRFVRRMNALRFALLIALLCGLFIAAWAADDSTVKFTAPAAAPVLPGTATTPATAPAATPAAAPAAGTLPIVLPSPPPIAWVKPTPVDMPLVPVRLCGSLAILNAGKISPWDLVPFDTTGLIGALGTGTVHQERSTGELPYETSMTTGEMINFAGRTFVRSTNPKTGVQVVEVSSPFRSPFAIGALASPGIVPRLYRFAGDEPRLLHSVLEELGNLAGYPLGVLGWVKMPEAKGTALKRAPIEGEALLGNTRDNYVETIDKKNVNVIFFAVVIPGVLPRPSLNAYLLSKAAIDLDEDPGESGATLIRVEGALVTEELPQDFVTKWRAGKPDAPAPTVSVETPPDYFSSPMLLSRMSTATINDIVHLQGSSTVQNGAMLVYRLQYAK